MVLLFKSKHKHELELEEYKKVANRVKEETKDITSVMPYTKPKKNSESKDSD